MGRYFLVPDVHGELDMAAGLLEQEGLLNDEWERVEDDNTTVQLGDFLNCVVNSLADDNRCLDHNSWFDVLLVGNHEHPYFGGPAFNGFWKDPVLTHRLRSLDSQRRYKVALDCDGVLVTHAGLASDLYKKYEPATSEQWAGFLNYLWSNPEHKASHELLCAIGWDRGGHGREGGVLWSDWKQYKTSKLKQVFGHSVGEYVRVQRNGWQANIEYVHEFNSFIYKETPKNFESLCIDLGAGKHSPTIVGAWVEDGNVRLVEYTKE